MPFISEGQHVKLTGEWKIHQKFGAQFNVKELEEIFPTSIEEIEKYLSSGIIRGIGPVTAKKIINYFGEDTLNILDNEIERLREIEGIGEKKFNIIYKSYEEQHHLKNIVLYFQQYGISYNQCLKICTKLGVNAPEIVKENPYILCHEIKGIGFSMADKIASINGLDKESDFRVICGIQFILNRFCIAGNTFMPKNILISQTKELLNVPENIIEQGLYNGHLENKFIVEKVNDIEGVFLPLYNYSENGITKKIAELSMENFQVINTDIEFEIQGFEKKQGISFAKSQKEAIVGAFTNGIEIITGGPGTGKTTIIKCIIDIYENQGMKVLLGAPTGRAAKRMTESTEREAKTIHRLLDMVAGDEEYINMSSTEPLECDVLIVDEASMIDIFLMHNLLKSIKLGTRLIIVGDVDQLPSVGAGNVLKDLINSDIIKVVRLKEIFRSRKRKLNYN